MPARTGQRTPAKQFEDFLSEFTPDVAKTARAALAKLRKQVPPSIEMVYDNYNGLVVGFSPSMRASEAVFSIAIFPTHVSLCFLFGAALADPKKILAGAGNRVRHIKLASAADLDRADVGDLIARAAKGAQFPKQSRKLLIKSISPKRRPRRPLST